MLFHLITSDFTHRVNIASLPVLK